MTRRIYLDASFRSYAAFQAAFADYCNENAIANVPLTFVRHTSKKLKVNTFKNDPLDRETIDQFVYCNLSLKCIHHESITTNESGPCCTGRITLFYNRLANVLKVTAIVGHSNHPIVDSNQDDNTNGNSRLKEVLEIARQLPDDALALLEQVCKGIQENWNDENAAGLTVHIVPIESESQVVSHIKRELLHDEPGIDAVPYLL